VVKTIPGVVFSGTRKCFYVDDTEENLKAIFSTLRDHSEINIEQLTRSHYNEDDRSVTAPVAVKQEVRAENHLPPGKHTSVRFSINEKDGTLIIRLPLPYSPKWVSELKSYRGIRYDNVRKEWFLPWSKLTCDSLADYFGSRGINVEVKKTVVDEGVLAERKKTGDEIRDRDLGPGAMAGLDRMAEYLDENRYSPRTRESYLAMLDFYFRYFSDRDPFNISGREISRFISDYIIGNNYSASYHNQMVSAIRTFYYIHGKDSVEIDLPVRPRRSRSLPKTFSKEEVSRILNSPGNIKHKLLLWIIYSCGLRRSEVTNIKLEDLDRDRSIIHINEGKGMVDRIVPVPVKVWNKIDEYLAGYNPSVYLFEGQSGGRYSSESVYRVFKAAMVKAGIKKDVGVHCLRHSYATHLHENGLDIRYIQELLGHKNTRTTEIYTHVSRRNLITIRSPIEDLELH
jgi:site-specific recombinase XerD